ncbi:unnamed protein product [Nippostrongylus brasiliensis]|uniref:Putative malate dehydrogenase (inferred by orthology to a S. mansoni protein) n=1 Tax=Nippostrongylus brasiliensis TaxID=27835 RepID=A0A0N4YAI6_NIPBR|nr:unnamed protein product [Nippostrongylus brasiliensis]
MIIKKKFDELEEIVVSKKELRLFVLNCLEKVGCSSTHAQQLADILICSDYRGHYSHGLNRLHIYVNDLAEKSTAGDGEPVVIKEKGATAWVDGCNLLGPVVGNFCMKLAVQKARTHGIGWVVVKNSNHFGIAGWYAESALQQGLVGMAFTNTSPCVFPTNSSEKSLGSNPICLAAPAANGDSFFLDMASTTVAYGKIEVVDRRGGKRIPRCWGADSEGIETQDPKQVLNGGGLQPLGGSETTGGYKGTGLCMMVEVLCGIMAGSSFGKSIRKWQTTEENANLGQCFIAVDPDCFAPGFRDRLGCFLDETRDLKPVDQSHPVQVPGDPERAHMFMCDELDGIVYKKSQLEHLEKLADDLAVPMFRTKKVAGAMQNENQVQVALDV